MELALSRGMATILDDADYEYFSQWKYYANRQSGRFYAVRKYRVSPLKRTALLLHREIMQPPPGFIVDHINHDTLDNRRCNLRLATVSQNQQNTSSHRGSSSQYLGVCLGPNKKSWRATIMVNGQQKHLGHYENEIDAAIAYDRAAAVYHGQFANFNLPELQRACMEANR